MKVRILARVVGVRVRVKVRTSNPPRKSPRFAALCSSVMGEGSGGGARWPGGLPIRVTVKVGTWVRVRVRITDRIRIRVSVRLRLRLRG